MALSPRTWTRLAIGSVAAVLLAVTLDVTVGQTPGACSLCHAVQSDALALDSHESVGCLACHLEAGPWSAPGFIADKWTRMYSAQVFSAGSARAVDHPSQTISREACLDCHGPVNESLVESRGLRIRHDTCAGFPVRCESCHGAVAHGAAARWPGQPRMDECVTCHAQESASRECDTCHDGRLTAERLRAGPWRNTHGPQWSTTHAMGTYETCATCHPDGYCERCHGISIPHASDFGSQHGKVVLGGEVDCESCHRAASFCEGCHGVDMPHPDAYLVTHASDANDPADTRCGTCHDAKACVTCHERHVHPYGPWTFERRGDGS